MISTPPRQRIPPPGGGSVGPAPPRFGTPRFGPGKTYRAAQAVVGRLELRQLRYFVAVAEELHFGRAALRLHMTQPPLSQQIQSLEREVGTPLLQRDKRHVELTDAGRAFLDHARRALLEAEEAKTAAMQAASGTLGRLFIGCNAYGRWG